METNIFTLWAEKFVSETKTIPQDGRKVLPTHYGYKRHLRLKALEISRRGNNLTYIIPSHTNGKCRPLNCGFLELIEERLRTEMIKSTFLDDPTFDHFDFLNMLKVVYLCFSTAIMIFLPLHRVECIQLMHLECYTYHIHHHYPELNRMHSAEEMVKLVTTKRHKALQSANLQLVAVRCGHISTQKGLFATSAAALDAIQSQGRATANCLSARAAAKTGKHLRYENKREMRRTLRELELHKELSNRIA